MNSRVFFILLLMIAGVAVFGMTSKPKAEAVPVASARSGADSASNPLNTESKTMGVVSVEVTPISIEPGEKVTFDLVMNNHSVDLGYDYTQIATLTDDHGNTYKPEEWTGNSGGHHVSGQLIFPALINEQKQLTLTLDGIDDQTDEFSWEL